ncbi:MAG: hypothetical protein GX971_01780 [Firmicutes bacterium]|nr:hypothetical protein [Bacillota bacterium]
MLAQFLVYPVLVLVVTVFLLITVPRDRFRILLPYGVVLGGLVDFVDDLIVGKLFRAFTFANMGLFDASGHLLLAPIAWTLLVVFYLHFWPDENKQLGYFYALGWTLLATGFSQVVRNVSLFDYSPWFYPVPMFVTFLIRFIFITWIAGRFALIRI